MHRFFGILWNSVREIIEAMQWLSRFCSIWYKHIKVFQQTYAFCNPTQNRKRNNAHSYYCFPSNCEISLCVHHICLYQQWSNKRNKTKKCKSLGGAWRSKSKHNRHKQNKISTKQQKQQKPTNKQWQQHRKQTTNTSTTKRKQHTHRNKQAKTQQQTKTETTTSKQTKQNTKQTNANKTKTDDNNRKHNLVELMVESAFGLTRVSGCFIVGIRVCVGNIC